MTNKTNFRYSFVGFLGVFVAVVYWIFRVNRKQILNDLMAGSEVKILDSGLTEFSRVGSGPAVLVLHGTLGGYDQGLAIAEILPKNRFQVIVVSRAGYLRSGLSTGRTAADQADSYAMLLDALGLDRVAVLATSGGGPSALQFVLRHPERCWGLVLLSAITKRPERLPPFFQMVIAAQDFLLRFDFIWWLFYKIGLPVILTMNGLSLGDVVRISKDPEKMVILRRIYKPIATASRRRLGVKNDQRHIENLQDETLDEIETPVWIAHSSSDTLIPYEDVRQVSAEIPGAAFLLVKDGGHVFFISEKEKVAPRLLEFLTRHQPDVS